MRLALRAAAVGDLDAIFDFGVADHGADTASASVRSIDAVLDRLRAYPVLGPLDKVRAGLRSIPAVEHRIFYRIEGDAIIVVRVLHKAMDVERWA